MQQSDVVGLLQQRAGELTRADPLSHLSKQKSLCWLSLDIVGAAELSISKFNARQLGPHFSRGSMSSGSAVALTQSIL